MDLLAYIYNGFAVLVFLVALADISLTIISRRSR